MSRVVIYCWQILLIQASWQTDFKNDVLNDVTCLSVTVVAVMDAK
jgi:hypothetical protein